MKYSSFIKNIKYKLNSKDENTNLNPLYDENLKKFDLIEYSKIKKFDVNQLIEDECCICFEKLYKRKTICLPFKCNHILCFSCFVKYCNSCRKTPQKKENLTNKVFCPLCREGVSLDWKQTKRISYFKDTLKKKVIEIVYPSSISDNFLT